MSKNVLLLSALAKVPAGNKSATGLLRAHEVLTSLFSFPAGASLGDASSSSVPVDVSSGFQNLFLE